jgi:putative PIN family toxin of toxin-antitoxin system
VEAPPLRLVLDTNVLVAATRSRTGASNALLRELECRAFVLPVSVPLFVEYEAVLSRPELIEAAGRVAADAAAMLNMIAALAEPVHLRYSWRPQLTDPGDEMVLDTAINARANAIVTYNRRHLGPARRFGIEVWSPAEVLRRLRNEDVERRRD